MTLLLKNKYKTYIHTNTTVQLFSKIRVNSTDHSNGLLSLYQAQLVLCQTEVNPFSTWRLHVT